MLTPPVIFDIFKAREEFRKNDVSHAQEKTHIREILNFYNECTRRYHIFFIKKKYSWQTLFPRNKKPYGLLACIDSITGEWQNLSEQKVWSWGDGRALGIWSYHLLKGILPDDNVTFEANGRQISVNLQESYREYCENLASDILSRLDIHCGKVPFVCGLFTNTAEDGPAGMNSPENNTRSYSDLFCAGGLAQYALYKADTTLLHTSRKLLDEIFSAITNFRFTNEPQPGAEGIHSHGPRMIYLGVCVEFLKSFRLAGTKIQKAAMGFSFELITRGISIIEYILTYHICANSGLFWELVDDNKNPYIDSSDVQLCDPGHAAEFSGFAAEFLSEVTFLNTITDCPEEIKILLSPEKINRILHTLVSVHMNINQTGFSKKGLMYKRKNLRSGNPIPDQKYRGISIACAPWWNIREHAAASLKLFELTRDERCLYNYADAQRISYTHYPNPRIDGLMYQTLDAETAVPLPCVPATANLDPLHDQRARDRETEVLSNKALHGILIQPEK